MRREWPAAMASRVALEVGGGFDAVQLGGFDERGVGSTSALRAARVRSACVPSSRERF